MKTAPAVTEIIEVMSTWHNCRCEIPDGGKAMLSSPILLCRYLHVMSVLWSESLSGPRVTGDLGVLKWFNVEVFPATELRKMNFMPSAACMCL